jgi:leader peptidase (prepilin peptidase) / N-methyltransferase
VPAGLTIAFLGGLVAGSFVTVVAHRVPRGLSIIGPGSQCPGCGARIAPYDNLPVISWLLLRGRRRCCGGAISTHYPLAELSLAVLFAAAVAVLRGDPAELALGLVLVSLLVAITLTDVERLVIPNAIVLAGAICGLAIATATDPGSLAERGVAALAAGGLLLSAWLAYPRGMGMGDVKLAAVMGLYLGRGVAPALLVGFAAGAIYGLALMLRHGAAARKAAIPFGPFLALGGVVGLLAGDLLIDAYLDGL